MKKVLGVLVLGLIVSFSAVALHAGYILEDGMWDNEDIINIINDKEVIPELLQSECNAKEIFTTVNYFLKKPEMILEQLTQIKKTINEIKSETSSAEKAAKILSENFVS